MKSQSFVRSIRRLVVSSVMTAVASLAVSAADHVYEWKSGEYPAQTDDGRVRFFYDVNNKITGMAATPDEGGRLVFRGDAMTFASDATVTNTAPGFVSFENVISGVTFRSRKSYADTLDKRTYGGHADTFIGTDWVTVLADASLTDWEPTTTTMTKPAGETFLGAWANPGNVMYVSAVRRTENALTFQFQTKAASSNGRYVSKCVKMELRQNGSDIQARATATTTSAVHGDSSTQTQTACFYDVDELSDVLPEGDVVKTKLYLNTDAAKDGYGVNSISFVRRNAQSGVSVAGGGALTGTLAPAQYTRLALDGADTLTGALAVWPSGEVSFRNASFAWSGYLSGGIGTTRFETTKEIGAAGVETPADTSVYLPNTRVKVASNRNLRDLVTASRRAWVIGNGGSMPNGTNTPTTGAGLAADTSASWCNFGGSWVGGESSYEIHPGNLFNLKFDSLDYTRATAQVQCQQGALLRCVYVKFEQEGPDIYAVVPDKSANYVYVTNETMRADARFAYDTLLGVDFDILHGMVAAERTARQVTIDTTTARATTEGGIGIRNLNLVFRKPTEQVVTLTKDAKEAFSGNVEIAGVPGSRMTVNVISTNALPLSADSVVRIHDNGELRYAGNWTAAQVGGVGTGVSKGMYGLVVEKGGLVRQAANYPFGKNQRIELNGGKLEFQGVSSASDATAYLYDLILRDGAEIVAPTGMRVRVGGGSKNVRWIVGGLAPSTNNVPLSMVGINTLAERSITFAVCKTGDETADFVQNAGIFRWSDDSFTNCVVRKTGSGTMLLNGDYDNAGAFVVENGTLALGRDGSWSSGAPLSLGTGTRLSVAAEAKVDGFGALVLAGDGASIALGEGADVTFAAVNDFEGQLAVTMPTNSVGGVLAKLRVAEKLSTECLRQIRVNGRRAQQDEDGSVGPYNRGFAIIFR